MKNYWQNKIKFLFIPVILLVAFIVIQNMDAVTLPNKYPRLANVYYDTNISDAEAVELAKWDILVVGIELQYNNPNFFNIVRAENPDIIILAYLASQELHTYYGEITDPNHPHAILYDGVNNDWFLKDTSNNKLSFWPGTYLMNTSEDCPTRSSNKYNTYLASFVKDTVISTGYWDGIFYDNVWNSISWVDDNIDIDLDGNFDTDSEIDTAWFAGMTDLMDQTTSKIGEQYIVIGNGGGSYYTYMNGRLIEDYPSEHDGDWPGATQKYFDVIDHGKNPPVVVINSMGDQDDYKKLRYTIASTLLDNGFFSYDYDITDHSQLWWYDEYNVKLGEPLSDSFSDKKYNTYQPDIWRRNFVNGLSIINSTDKTQQVELGGEFEKIHGTQDQGVNNGEIISELNISGTDGIVLLKTFSTIFRH